jgi:hypothetical protein
MKRMSILAIVAGAIVVVGGVGVYVLLLPHATSSSNSTSTANTITVIPSGTVYSLDAGYYEDIWTSLTEFWSNGSLVQQYIVTGSFIDTNGITAYIMTSDEYATWDSGSGSLSYQWTSGSDVTSGGIDTVLSSNTYYFVFENTNSITSTTVSITSDVVATAM